MEGENSVSETESDEEMDTVEEQEEDVAADSAKSRVFIPGTTELEEGEELVHDSSTYHMYHVAQTGAPCLSFDVLRDSLGEKREGYPMTAYLVAGTQSERPKQNHIILMKMSQLNKTSNKEENEDSDDDDDDDLLDDNEPDLDTVMVQHNGAINRIRVSPQAEQHLVATWSERGVVSIWDISKHVVMLDAPSVGGGVSSRNRLNGYKETPLMTFTGHKGEGYGLDWCGPVPGRLASGDSSGGIHVWNLEDGAAGGGGGSGRKTGSNKWLVDKRPFTGHTASVEDIQWSPNEQSVFASCSVDKTIRIWDCRAAPNKANMLTCHAHSSDVNVISWNRIDPFLVSGGDDGIIKVWDLRQFKKGEPVASFKHHSAPITSLEWHPSESTIFASSGEDNQVVQWDLSVETDVGVVSDEATPPGIPPQLLFIHQGQKEVKELHWHPQLPGVLVTTALTGFNIFRTISV